MHQRVTMSWAPPDQRAFVRVRVSPGRRTIPITLGAIPEGDTARASWLLPGDYRKEAEPNQLSNGRHEVRLNWQTATRLADAVLIIEMWCSTPPAIAPVVSVERREPEPMRPHPNMKRFGLTLLVDVVP